MGNDRYLNLIETALSGALFPEGKAERFIANLRQRIRNPYAARRGAGGRCGPIR
jgi:hypothetical protein